MTRRTRAGSRLNKKMDQNNNIISNDLDHQTFIHGTDPLMTDDIYTPEHSPSKNATKNQKKTTTGVEIAEDTEETELFPSPIAQQQPTEPATVVPPLIPVIAPQQQQQQQQPLLAAGDPMYSFHARTLFTGYNTNNINGIGSGNSNLNHYIEENINNNNKRVAPSSSSSSSSVVNSNKRSKNTTTTITTAKDKEKEKAWETQKIIAENTIQSFQNQNAELRETLIQLQSQLQSQQNTASGAGGVGGGRRQQQQQQQQETDYKHILTIMGNQMVSNSTIFNQLRQQVDSLTEEVNELKKKQNTPQPTVVSQPTEAIDDCLAYIVNVQKQANETSNKLNQTENRITQLETNTNTRFEDLNENLRRFKNVEVPEMIENNVKAFKGEDDNEEEEEE